MKEKYLINARIIDPKNNLDEIGSWYAAGYEAVKALAKDGW